MKCSQIKQNIELYVLGGLDEQICQKMQRHLRDCALCSSMVSDYEMLAAALRTQAEDISHEFLINRIMLSASPAISRQRHRKRIAVFFRAAVSAAACFAVTLGVLTSFSKINSASKSISGRIPCSTAAFLNTRKGWNFDSQLFAPADDNAQLIGTDRFVTLMHDRSGTRAVCVDSGTNAIRWKGVDNCLGYFATNSEMVYCVAENNDRAKSIVAMEAQTGRQIWQFSPPEHAEVTDFSCPYIAGENICWTAGQSVYMLDSTGKLLWQSALNEKGHLSSPVEANGYVYVADNKFLYRIDPEKGSFEKEFSYSCDTCSTSEPLIEASSERVYLSLCLSDGTSRVMCLDTSTDNTLWDKHAPRVTRISDYNGRVLVRCQHVYCLDGNSGTALWHYKARGCGPVICCSDSLVFVDQNDSGSIIAVQPDTGSQLWKLEGFHSCGGLVDTGEKGFLKTSDGMIHVISFG